MKRTRITQVTTFLHRMVGLLIRNLTWVHSPNCNIPSGAVLGSKSGKEQEFRMGLRIIVCAPIDYNNGLFVLGLMAVVGLGFV